MPLKSIILSSLFKQKQKKMNNNQNDAVLIKFNLIFRFVISLDYTLD
jgi:hypothetical protein